LFGLIVPHPMLNIGFNVCGLFEHVKQPLAAVSIVVSLLSFTSNTLQQCTPC